MRFISIEPAETRVTTVEADNLFDLYQPLGLARTQVDHGQIVPPHTLPNGAGVAIVVQEFSLFVPTDKQRYFCIGRRLFAGNALLYGFDETGETIDLIGEPEVVFMSSAGVEAAIGAGQIERPTMSVDGEQIWQWPEPSPFELRS
jgi:hypothetical protein